MIKMGNLHLIQVHLKWVTMWLLLVSVVIASPVAVHLLQVVPSSTSAMDRNANSQGVFDKSKTKILLFQSIQIFSNNVAQ